MNYNNPSVNVINRYENEINNMYDIYWYELMVRGGCVILSLLFIFGVLFDEIELVFDLIRDPVDSDGVRFVWSDPEELLGWSQFVSSILSLILVYPFLLYQLVKFLQGGLVSNELNVLVANCIRSFLVVFISLLFCQYGLAPVEWEGLNELWVGERSAMPSLGSYLKLWCECLGLRVFIGHLPFLLDLILSSYISEVLGYALVRRMWMLSMVCVCRWMLPIDDFYDMFEVVVIGMVIFEYCLFRRLRVGQFGLISK